MEKRISFNSVFDLIFFHSFFFLLQNQDASGHMIISDIWCLIILLRLVIDQLTSSRVDAAEIGFFCGWVLMSVRVSHFNNNVLTWFEWYFLVIPWYDLWFCCSCANEVEHCMVCKSASDLGADIIQTYRSTNHEQKLNTSSHTPVSMGFVVLDLKVLLHT